MLRIGVVSAIPTPYRDPFWNAVAAEPDTSLHVYYCAAVSPDRPWLPSWPMRYNHEVLNGINIFAPFSSRGFSYWNPDINTRLEAGRHDALLIGGYNYPTMLAAVRFARRKGIPYFLMSESHLNEPRTRWRRVFKRPIVKWVVRGAAGCFPTGKWAADYLIHYGAKADRLCFLPNVPDVDFLDRKSWELAAVRSEVREQLGLGATTTVLFLGRLVDFKRVDLLIEAFAKVDRNIAARLAIVGDGLERSRLERLASRLGIADRVLFKGFIEPEQVPQWYAAADLMVLPSVGETWSVAVVEALASALPVVTTDTVGAAADTITNPVVGTIVPSNDVDALAAAIQERLTKPVGRRLIREHWADVRERFRYESLARDVVSFVDRIIRAA